MSLSNQNTPFETLTAEALYIVIDLLSISDIKQLSCTNTWLRGACLPFLFRHVEFPFSKAGFDGLRSLLESEARQYVVSFTYRASELLNPDTFSFNTFKSHILTPDAWAERAWSMHASGIAVDNIPHYMTIYGMMAATCDEQCDIINEALDYTILSSVLGALPHLREISLNFDATPRGQEWLTRFLQYSRMTMYDRSCLHHIRVVSSALRRARNRGVQVATVNLSQLSCIARDTRQDCFCRQLSKPLTELLASVQVLRVARCTNVVEVLSQCVLALRHFDMCRIYVPDESLKVFLKRNKKSLRSISFHNVSTSQPNQLGISFYKLSLDMLCGMLNVVAHSMPSQDADCEGCLPSGAKGSRLMLEPDHMAGRPAVDEPSSEVSAGAESGMPHNSR